ncbi:MAG: LytTR family DNA-binding domain-containing protein [Pseudomonadota bacterium]
MRNAFVVDDEPMARGNLIDALQQHRGWQVQQALPSGERLIAEVIKHEPDVVFLDIQMPGEDGMDVARRLLRLQQAPLIVFVTAHSQYAVEAFELYAVDYLLKPFNDDRLAQCVAKLEHQLDNRSANARVRSAQLAWAESSTLERVVIKSSNSVRIIETTQILWIAANGNYVDIHHTDGKHLLRASLKHFLERLPHGEFIQLHRSYAVRSGLIREIKADVGERHVAVLSTGENLPVGKSFRAALLGRLCG